MLSNQWFSIIYSRIKSLAQHFVIWGISVIQGRCINHIPHHPFTNYSKGWFQHFRYNIHTNCSCNWRLHFNYLHVCPLCTRLLLSHTQITTQTAGWANVAPDPIKTCFSTRHTHAYSTYNATQISSSQETRWRKKQARAWCWGCVDEVCQRGARGGRRGRWARGGEAD